jgi:hypothetical protein
MTLYLTLYLQYKRVYKRIVYTEEDEGIQRRSSAYSH